MRGNSTSPSIYRVFLCTKVLYHGPYIRFSLIYKCNVGKCLQVRAKRCRSKSSRPTAAAEGKNYQSTSFNALTSGPEEKTISHLKHWHFKLNKMKELQECSFFSGSLFFSVGLYKGIPSRRNGSDRWLCRSIGSAPFPGRSMRDVPRVRFPSSRLPRKYRVVL